MSTAKDAMIEIIGRQPDDSSYDEILRELAFARMVQRGLDDSDADRTLSDSDVRKKIDSWQKYYGRAKPRAVWKRSTIISNNF